ncbi:MAG: transposase [Chloroflexi bacterium]|nr:transposase [Chloroflexota bacterium]
MNDPEFLALHQTFQTKITIAVELVAHAIANEIPFGTVLFDSWFLARELIAVLKRHNKNWISILKSNRNVLTSSCLTHSVKKQSLLSNPLDRLFVSNNRPQSSNLSCALIGCSNLGSKLLKFVRLYL